MRKTTSTNFINRRYISAGCPMTVALEMIAGRWKMQILCCINFGENHFGAMKRRMPGISDRMLGLKLRDLAADGLILKTQELSEITYQLTDKGHKLIPVLNKLTDWHLGL